MLEAMRRDSRWACMAQSFREIVSVDRHIIVKLDGRVFKGWRSVEGCGVDRRQEVAAGLARCVRSRLRYLGKPSRKEESASDAIDARRAETHSEFLGAQCWRSSTNAARAAAVSAQSERVISTRSSRSSRSGKTRPLPTRT